MVRTFVQPLVRTWDKNIQIKKVHSIEIKKRLQYLQLERSCSTFPMLSKIIIIIMSKKTSRIIEGNFFIFIIYIIIERICNKIMYDC